MSENLQMHKASVIKSLLTHKGYRQYNVSVSKRLGGIEYAVLLNDLIDQYDHLEETDQLVSHLKYGDGLMYYTINQAYERCGISKDSFEAGLKLFISLGFFSCVVKFGIPPKRYFKIDLGKIYDWLFSNNVYNLRKPANCIEETRKTFCGNPQTNDKENDIYNNTYNRSTPPPSTSKEKSSSYKNNKIVFDPTTYKLKNGKNLKDITIKSYLNKMKDPVQRHRIESNVIWYENQVDSGLKPDNHEAVLQYAITKDMARVSNAAWTNETYAKLMKEEHKLNGLKILKTVVHLDKMDGSKPESVSLNLPHESFSSIIDNYISTTKE